MAQRALTAGPRRRRALFGLVDAEGWSWASVKAFFWFIIIIFLLGYLPDRAYYFTVFPTIDLGILAWSPINLCPPENGSLPCPAPAGSTVAWQKNPDQLALPRPVENGVALQVGSTLLYVGGQNDTGGGATDAVEVARTSGIGNFDRWQAGPKLPAPRTDPAGVVFNGSVYVFGGADASGKAQADAYILTPDQSSGDLGDWKTSTDAKLKLDLPEPRVAAAAIAVADGIVVAGGDDASGKPTTTVWKTTVDSSGKLGPWVPQASLASPQAGAVGAQAGNTLYVFGGSDANGPTRTVQVGNLGAAAPGGGAGASASPGAGGGAAGGSPAASGSGAASASGAASPAASGAASPAASGAAGPAASGAPAASGSTSATSVGAWQAGSPLPAARANPAGFAANGTIYLVGGSDGQTPAKETYWATPDSNGSVGEWKHLAQMDLPDALEGSSAVVLGSEVVLVGGRTQAGVTTGQARANLAPQAPFFQLGLVGATVPALKIEGEIGQQLGYLNAAAVGTVDFALLVVIGVALAHRDRTRELIARLRRRRET